MNNRNIFMYMQRFTLGSYLALAATASFAIETVESSPKALSPTQIQAIRGISRYVLAAKKSGIEDGVDVAQLARLRSTVDQLIATELEVKDISPIDAQTQVNTESSSNGKQRAHNVSAQRARDSAHIDAMAVAAQVRSHGEQLTSRSRVDESQDAHSAGLPIGAQRGRSFERWAQKLDASMADGNEQRMAQLTELRAQLDAGQGRALQKVPTRGTPTMQAMPWNYVPPKGVPTENEQNKAQGESQ